MPARAPLDPFFDEQPPIFQVRSTRLPIVLSVGEAKARLSALARAAAHGEPTIRTDYGEPRAP